jgi:hypothetical protein
MGFMDRLKRPDREKEAWTLWPGDSYLIEVTSPEVLELARSKESLSKFVSIHSRENILEIRFEGQELGLFNSEDSKYYRELSFQ